MRALKSFSASGGHQLQPYEVNVKLAANDNFIFKPILHFDLINSTQHSRLSITYTKARDSKQNKYEHTGLGLAISKQIIELMCGNISPQSELQMGSTFCSFIEPKA
jgi:signal transduction histidine kinase